MASMWCLSASALGAALQIGKLELRRLGGYFDVFRSLADLRSSMAVVRE
jgi:hypothetical protein